MTTALCISLASVGWVTFFGCTVVSTVMASEILELQRAGLVRHPQALLKQDIQLLADASAPVAQPGPLMREAVLKEWPRR